MGPFWAAAVLAVQTRNDTFEMVPDPPRLGTPARASHVTPMAPSSHVQWQFLWRAVANS
jgi:hypothetical protein